MHMHMVNPDVAVEPIYATTVQSIANQPIVLPVSKDTPLFVVGPNGAGKSGLMSALYRANAATAVRISAHRQNTMASNSIPFSPSEKIQNENMAKGQDSQPSARWLEWNANMRAGLILADLIEGSNNLSRKIHAKHLEGDPSGAAKLATTLPPLEKINLLLAGAGIPIKLIIKDDGSVVASKRGGAQYSIAALSDGERAALLVAGAVLTAKPGSLIIIDEPERHLHISIVTPLLLQLFSEKSDCSFVVSTHELGLPINCHQARTVLVRDSQPVGDDIQRWDLDVLEPGIEVDDSTKEALIGARRKMLFVEGTSASLDQPLYEILFPGVSVFPRESCGDVEHAVISLRDAQSLAWVQAFGIVDQDQLDAAKKAELRAKGVFALQVYSVEGLYYDPTIVRQIAERQCTVVEGDPQAMTDAAVANALHAVSEHAERMAARMTEQSVKDQISLGRPDWKKIKAGASVNITVDAQTMYQTELANLQALIAANNITAIMARYPIRETPALGAIVTALNLKSLKLYEAAVRKLLAEDAATRARLLGLFGDLPAAIN